MEMPRAYFSDERLETRHQPRYRGIQAGVSHFLQGQEGKHFRFGIFSVVSNWRAQPRTRRRRRHRREASEPETWAVPSVAGVSLLPAEVKPMGLAEASVDVENGLTESVEVPAVSAFGRRSLTVQHLRVFGGVLGNQSTSRVLQQRDA